MRAIKDTEDKLVSWDHRQIKGNLCNELDRLHNKHSRDIAKSVLDILRLSMDMQLPFLMSLSY